MSINPIKLTNNILNDYIRFLTSSFRIRDKEFHALFKKTIKKSEFLKGPILEATPPFRKGTSIRKLIEENVLHKDFEKFIYYVLPYFTKKNLYSHQESAIRKIFSQRNVIISTGTGSGKTESFLIPIYNYLINEYHMNKKLDPGVRALILYPMNALANDQVRRLRNFARWMKIKTPEINITFGRYIGETLDKEADAIRKFQTENDHEERIENELLSREEMRKNPPHILISNYAMLEYLLLRPGDSSFFDGEYSQKWKFLILDEAHVYNGAKGTEIAMLIRRLKDRITRNRKKSIQCIATSATLGNGNEDNQKVLNFASNLFNESFEWNKDDPNRQDIITSERDNLFLKYKNHQYEIDKSFYNEFNKKKHELKGNNLINFCLRFKFPKELISKFQELAISNPSGYIYWLLSYDLTITKLRNLLEKKPLELKKIPEMLDSTYTIVDIINIIDIGVWAKIEENSSNLIPARYHLFVRSPEGIFIGFFPKKVLYLQPHKKNEKGFPVYEISTCRQCGQEYIHGSIEENKLVTKNKNNLFEKKKQKNYYMISEELEPLVENEDDNVYTPKINSKIACNFFLCSKCSAISKDIRICDCKETKILKLLEIIPKDGKLNKCYSCGLSSINIVKEFYFQKDKPSSVLALTLFKEMKNKLQNKKKILTFSDSRQDSAFFASFINSTHERYLHRRIIYEVISKNKDDDDYRLNTLCNDVLKISKQNELFSDSQGTREIKSIVWGWVLNEFFTSEKRISIEGIGLSYFEPIFPKSWEPPLDFSLDPWNLSTGEIKSLYILILNTLRFKKAITFPEHAPSPTDEIFSRFHQNKEFFFRGEISDTKKGIYAFIPNLSFRNSRLEILQKLYKTINDKEPDKSYLRILLGKIWEDLTNNWLDHGIYQKLIKGKGFVFQLDYRFWKINPNSNLNEYNHCELCGQIQYYSVKGICTTYNCKGLVIPISDNEKKEEIKNNYYRKIYQTLPINSLVAHEHSAQLQPSYASEVQQKFINGKINLLSCSTTFEMGVDLGELEFVFLKNVPPEPSNYIQRAGRAGRRSDSVGFTLTFALLRSHDLSYFNNPLDMISGRVKPPIVKIKNGKIVRRHLHSIVISKFWKIYPNFYGSVNNFFALDDKNSSGVLKIKEYLKSKPKGIYFSLKNVIPSDLHSYFNIEKWGWVDEFLGKEGSLTNAEAQIKSEYDDLIDYQIQKKEELINSIRNGGKKKTSIVFDIDWSDKRLNTIKKNRILSFLSSKTVIPKYGFPVDVVDLKIYSNLSQANNIRLERDLKMAISEYAPSSKIIANGYIWESAGLQKVRNKEWETYWYSLCDNCERLLINPSHSNDRPEEMVCPGCQIIIRPRNFQSFIIPIFGFTTKRDQKPEKPGDSRPRREFSSRPYFSSYSDPKEKEIKINNLKIKFKYSSQGKMVVICKGKGGFFICSMCGVGFKKKTRKTEHTNPFGGICKGIIKGPFHLGHIFNTDVLELDFHYQKKKGREKILLLSLLYALLEGACYTLGIQRRDVDGCIYSKNSKIVLMLFDNVPGGAGHTNEIFKGKNMELILKNSLKLLENCSCGLETSCNSCLRNYSNQFCHDILERGLVINFLKEVLS